MMAGEEKYVTCMLTTLRITAITSAISSAIQSFR